MAAASVLRPLNATCIRGSRFLCQSSSRRSAGSLFVPLLLVCSFGLLLLPSNAMIMDNLPYFPARLGDDTWYEGSATFYGNSDLSNGVTGACGYPWSFVNTRIQVAVPDPRFSDTLTSNVSNFNGAACGQCYQVSCYPKPRYGSHVYCTSTDPIMVTVTNYDTPPTGPWPNNHMDFYQPGFGNLADYAAGIINTRWKRVPCPSTAPKFTVSGNPYWHDITVYDIPDAGAVTCVWVKPAGSSDWVATQHGWGAHYWLNGMQVNWDDPDTLVKAQLAETSQVLYLSRQQAY